jgi:hypothetical protein
MSRITLKINSTLVPLLLSLMSLGQKPVLTYYEWGGKICPREDAGYFTVKNKTSDTCWTLDYYRVNGPLRRREQYRDKDYLIKHGEFSNYNYFGILDSTGCFFNGEQEGKWVLFGGIGIPMIEKIYRDGQLIQIRDISPGKIEASSDSASPPSKPIFPAEAVFPGGPHGWQKYLIAKMKIPDEVLKNINHMRADVMVSFTVERDGSIHDILLVKSLLYLLDDIALNLIKKSPNWIPASQDGIKIKSYQLQPIAFSIDSN